MSTDPCKTCLPSVPRHTLQRVVIRAGRRVQVCERCGRIVARLGQLKPEELEGIAHPGGHRDLQRGIVHSLAKTSLRSGYFPKDHKGRRRSVGTKSSNDGVRGCSSAFDC